MSSCVWVPHLVIVSVITFFRKYTFCWTFLVCDTRMGFENIHICEETFTVFTLEHGLWTACMFNLLDKLPWRERENSNDNYSCAKNKDNTVPQISCVSESFTLLKCFKKYNFMRIKNSTKLNFTQTRQIWCVRYNSFDRKCFAHLRYFLFVIYYRNTATLSFSKHQDDVAGKQSKIFKHPA